ncbi:MAG: hypothetical protein IPH13_17685 [Planctomycetes bacterium]|nr:hypothetical protein [Planctomycetota bacterium]
MSSTDTMSGETLRIPFSQLVEQVFELVREVRHRLEAEHPAVALEGVGGAEDAVQDLRIVWMILELQQAVFVLGQQFLGLFEEGLDDRILAHGRVSAK